MTETPDSLRARRLGAYAVLYVVWGSTYLAMAFAVETLPPFLLAGTRFLVSAALLLGFAAARGLRFPTAAQWRQAAVVGVLLLVVGNAIVVWAVQRVPSGTTALLVAVTPLWLAVFSRARPTRALVAGIALGLFGVGVLVGPGLARAEAPLDPLAVVLLLVASAAWAAGSLIARRGGPESSVVATGSQMLIGGALLVVFGSATGEWAELAGADVSARSVLALVYLTGFGSLLGFTSYGFLLRHDPPARVGTYAYINPVVAVVLGAVFAHELVSTNVVVAAAVIVAGVALIVRSSR